MCRTIDDVSQSPNRQDSSNNNSSSSLVLSTNSPRPASAVLLPGLDALQVRLAHLNFYRYTFLEKTKHPFFWYVFLFLRLWRPPVDRCHSTPLPSLTLRSCRRWPRPPGRAPLTSSPQPPRRCRRTCRRLRPRPCSTSGDFCPPWTPFLCRLFRLTAWPPPPPPCICSPHHAAPVTMGRSATGYQRVPSGLDFSTRVWSI